MVTTAGPAVNSVRCCLPLWCWNELLLSSAEECSKFVKCPAPTTQCALTPHMPRVTECIHPAAHVLMSSLADTTSCATATQLQCKPPHNDLHCIVQCLSSTTQLTAIRLQQPCSSTPNQKRNLIRKGTGVQHLGGWQMAQYNQ